MDKRNRLIEIIDQSGVLCTECPTYDCSLRSEDLADYLLANDVIVPLIKVGQKVYLIMRKGEIVEFEVIITNRTEMADGVCWLYDSTDGNYPMSFTNEALGKTVFLTREEAEQALKRQPVPEQKELD